MRNTTEKRERRGGGRTRDDALHTMTNDAILVRKAGNGREIRRRGEKTGENFFLLDGPLFALLLVGHLRRNGEEDEDVNCPPALLSVLSGGKTGEEAETHQVGCPLTDLHIHECTHSLQHISPPLSPFFFSSPLAPLLLLLRPPVKPFPLNLGVAATPPLTPTAILYPTLLPYVKTCCWVLLPPPFSCPNIWLFWHLPKTRRAGAGGGTVHTPTPPPPLPPPPGH